MSQVATKDVRESLGLSYSSNNRPSRLRQPVCLITSRKTEQDTKECNSSSPKLKVFNYLKKSTKTSSVGKMGKANQLATVMGSQDSIQDSWSSKAEKRVLRKCDLHVLPMLYILYMLSYLDRINIGNARIEGLERDLGMVGNDYNIALQIFFVPYILLEVPSNILLRRIAPPTWLSFIMFFWGALALRFSALI